MHQNAMVLMEQFVAQNKISGTVVDMGSYDVNGNYRHLFEGASYIGVDIGAGPNVDMIVGSEEWEKLANVDFVISGQTIEHVADIPAFMSGIYRILKPGGVLCIIAPSEGPPHHYPIWAGNFPEERMRQVVREGGFEILSCTISDAPPFNDCCCIAKKPESKTGKKGEKDEDQ